MQRAPSQLGRLSPDLFPPQTKSPAPMLDFLNARTDMRRKAGEIYGAIVTQARRPAFYADARCPRYTVGTLRDGGRSPFSGARAAARRLPTRRRRCRACWSKRSSPTWTIPCARWAPATSPFPRRCAAPRPGFTSAAWPTKAALAASDDGRPWRRCFAEHVYVDADARSAPRLAALRAGDGGALAATDADAARRRQLRVSGRAALPQRRHDERAARLVVSHGRNTRGGPAPDARRHRG